MLAGALHTHTYMGIYPQSLESELSSCRHELEESQSKMEELERSLDDKQEAVRVVEKKSQNMVSGINTGNAWHLHVHVHMQVALPFVWIRFA